MPEEIHDLTAQTAEFIYDAVEHGNLHPRPLVELIGLIGSVDAYLNSPEELTLHFYRKLETARNQLKPFGL
jgi:hypothetical protein